MPRDPVNWMWAEACEMLDQAERLHRRFFEPHPLTASRPVWEPPVDIVETREALKIIVVLPGVDTRSISVRVAGDVLIVAGERPLGIDPQTAVIHRLEIPYGRFERRLRLPSENFDVGPLEHVNGCLTIPLFKVDL